MSEPADYQPAPIDALHSEVAKLRALAALVEQAQDLGAVDCDGLGLLLDAVASAIDRAAGSIQPG